ncbi:MAG: aminotransferase class V-fold PLP-dependent enzyme [Pyrinomonadaceae bacterium]|nr:aminotransferase class V-fold PLP-dependent enzyme [Pyrinomonadaceae bacterium]
MNRAEPGAAATVPAETESLREQLRVLETESRRLEPDAAAREAVRRQVVDYSEEFLDTVSTLDAYTVTEQKGRGLLDSPIAEEGIGIDAAIDLVSENVDTPGLNPASGGHLAYIPGGGIYYSALGDYLADVFNRYAGVFYASPGAVRMENMLIRWMCDLVGYGDGSHGNMTSSGSLANMIAIVAARDGKGIGSADVARSVIYLSKQTHHSVAKAINVAGLAECPVRYIELDDQYRMNADDLSVQIEKDKADGLKPFLVVASAGTTDVGAIDPLPEIGAIAAEHNLWYHIDAAYGGFFILTDEGKVRLRGLELADSLIMDPHKGLFLPYGLGVVLVKDIEHLKRAYAFNASYMQDAFSAPDEISPAEVSPELTKHFRGLRLWLPLKLHGVAPFRACLEEKLLLAKYFHFQVQQLGFVSDLAPELSVVTYRFVPVTGDANEFNKKLLDAVVADGRVFISSTMLDGRFTLRFACLAFRTHLQTVDLLLDVLRTKVHEMER